MFDPAPQSNRPCKLISVEIADEDDEHNLKWNPKSE